MLKYGINTAPARNKFEKLTESQTYKFDWLGMKFPTMQDCVFACIACEFASLNIPYDSRDEIYRVSREFIGRRAALSYNLGLEYERHEQMGLIPFDQLFMQFTSGKFSPEYVLLVDLHEKQLDLLYNNKNYVWAKPEILKLMKYRGFVNISKHSSIIKHHVDEKTEV